MKKIVCMTISLVIFSLVCSFSNASAEYLPDKIQNIITRHASDRYPNNEVLQQRWISLQTKAYFKIQGYQNEMITDQEMKVIKGQATRKFPDSFVHQLTFIDKQSKKFLAKEENPENGIQ